jgi:hypothetical protein
MTFDLGLSLGGVGLLEYSVKLRVFMLGVLGLEGVPLPLAAYPFSIFLTILCKAIYKFVVVLGIVFVCNVTDQVLDSSRDRREPKVWGTFLTGVVFPSRSYG